MLSNGNSKAYGFPHQARAFVFFLRFQKTGSRCGQSGLTNKITYQSEEADFNRVKVAQGRCPQLPGNRMALIVVMRGLLFLSAQHLGERLDYTAAPCRRILRLVYTEGFSQQCS